MCVLTSFAGGHGASGFRRIMIFLCLVVMVGSALPVLASVGMGGAMVMLPRTPSAGFIWMVVCCSAPEYEAGLVAVGTGGGAEVEVLVLPPWRRCGLGLTGGGGLFLAWPGLLTMSFLMVVRSRVFSAICSC